MMKLKKLLAVVFLGCLLISSSVPVSYSQPTDEKNVEFTFDSQMDVLQGEMFPKIKKHIHEFDYKCDQESSDKLIQEIAVVIAQYIKDKKISIIQVPDIAIYKFNNGVEIAYTLQIRLVMPDYSERSPKFLSTMYVGKTFIIKIKNSQQSEI